MGHVEFKVELKKLRRALDGHLPKVAERTGLSLATVSRVMNGDYVNKDVIKAAIELSKELNGETEDLLNEIKQAVK